MRRLVLMCIVGLAAFVLASHAADAKGVKLTKGQVQTVCDGKTECQKNCGLQGNDLCTFKCKGDKCEGKCLVVGMCRVTSSRTSTQSASLGSQYAVRHSVAFEDGLERYGPVAKSQK